MEAVNEGCKFVAKARELIKQYIDAVHEHEIYELTSLNEARILLDNALEKLAV